MRLPFGYVAVAAVFVAGTLMMTASCGDDETGSGGATTTVGPGTGGSQGGMGGDGGQGATGGSPPMLECDLDAKCKSTEDCACMDCWYEAKCNSKANCLDDTSCTGSEGCFCADCAAEPACADYCISCLQLVTYWSDAAALCTSGAPSSQSLWQDFEACACGTCISDCGSTVCQGTTPNQPCIDCLAMSCDAEQQACEADLPAPFIQCNPVTAEPCNLNERCDIVTLAGQPIGFQCFIAENNAATCDECLYMFGSQSYCEAGNTCVDAAGQLTNGGTCGRYCCDDGDCGTGTCQKGQFSAAPDLGICVGMMGPACDAPVEAPSMGSCVTITN
jgi:hypothetical protein